MSVVTSTSAPVSSDEDLRIGETGKNPPINDAHEASTARFQPLPTLIVHGGRVVFASPGSTDLFRAASGEALLGLDVAELMTVDPGYASKGDLPDQPVAVQCRCQDGAVINARAAIVPIRWQGASASLACLWPRSDEHAAGPSDPAPSTVAPPSEEQERLALAFGGADIGLWDWHVDSGVFFMSPEFKAFLDFGVDELSDTLASWSRLIDKADIDINERRMIDHLEGRAPSYQSEIRVRTKGGGERWLGLQGKAVRGSDNRVHRVVGIAVEVSERKLREMERAETVARAIDTQAQFADAMDVAGQGFALFDAQDRLVLFNDQFQNMFPEAAGAVVPGARFDEVMELAVSSGVLRNDGGDRDASLHGVIERHKNPDLEPFVVRTGDGHSIQITKRRTKDGGTVIIRTEITRLKEAEQALQNRIAELEAAKAMLEKQSAQLSDFTERLAEAKDEADAANHTKSEFLANMSHELRTPLNAVMGFAEVIKNEMFGPVGVPRYTDYAGDIYNSGAHLLEIINDILDLSKIEAGKLDLTEEDINLREVAEAVTRLVTGRADEGGVKLVQDIHQDLPLLYSDKRKLKQMLLNLLTNAIKFTPNAGTVDMTAALNDDGRISVCVRDTGIGIAEDQFDLVMSPFGQVDSALAREHQGTGLGLPLVNALLELHGGVMNIASEIGKGTTITLHFPASRSRPNPQI